MNPITIILLFCTSFLVAQERGTASSRKSPVFEPRFDGLINAGVSIPLGKFRLLADESDDRSAATYGFYTEIAASMTPLPSSPWRTGLTIGYMHHPFEVEKCKEEFGLPIFEASPWNSFYVLLGVSVLSNKKKLCYGIGFDAGVTGYSGGNMVSGRIEMDTMVVRNWEYPIYAAITIKGNAFLGYHLKPNLAIFANISVFYAVGVRYGDFDINRYMLDAQNKIVQPSVDKESYLYGTQMTIFTLNLGLSIRYKFYKEPESFNYQFNINENR